jgi:hypothetical protein
MGPGGGSSRVHRIFTNLAARNCGKVAVPGVGRARPGTVALDSHSVKRTLTALLSIWATMLVLAPAALADNGVGLAGPTTDKTVTFFCFGVIAFFAILVIVMSVIQGRLEKRKEVRREDLRRYG